MINGYRLDAWIIPKSTGCTDILYEYNLAMVKQSVLECPSAVGMDATSARKNGPQTADA